MNRISSISSLSSMTSITSSNNNDDTIFSPTRTPFLCKCCRKSLISKNALASHQIRCFQDTIARLQCEHNNSITELKQKFTNHIDKLTSQHSEQMTKMYVSLKESEKRWNDLLINNFDTMKKIVFDLTETKEMEINEQTL
jgi:hypothetical protein